VHLLLDLDEPLLCSPLRAEQRDDDADEEGERHRDERRVLEREERRVVSDHVLQEGRRQLDQDERRDGADQDACDGAGCREPPPEERHEERRDVGTRRDREREADP
jgi:hypothetical protein